MAKREVIRQVVIEITGDEKGLDAATRRMNTALKRMGSNAKVVSNEIVKAGKDSTQGFAQGTSNASSIFQTFTQNLKGSKNIFTALKDTAKGSMDGFLEKVKAGDAGMGSLGASASKVFKIGIPGAIAATIIAVTALLNKLGVMSQKEQGLERKIAASLEMNNQVYSARQMVQEAKNLAYYMVKSKEEVGAIFKTALNQGIRANDVEKIVKLSHDVSKAVEKEFDPVFEAIVKAYNGQTRTLGMVLPQYKEYFKTLGDGSKIVEFLISKYDGMGKTMQQESMLKRLKTAWDELLDTLGSLKTAQAVTNSFNKIIGKVTEFIQKLDDAIAKRKALKEAMDGGKDDFSVDETQDFVKETTQQLKEQFAGYNNFLDRLAQGNAQDVYSLIKASFDWLTKSRQDFESKLTDEKATDQERKKYYEQYIKTYETLLKQLKAANLDKNDPIFTALDNQRHALELYSAALQKQRQSQNNQKSGVGGDDDGADIKQTPYQLALQKLEHRAAMDEFAGKDELETLDNILQAYTDLRKQATGLRATDEEIMKLEEKLHELEKNRADLIQKTNEEQEKQRASLQEQIQAFTEKYTLSKNEKTVLEEIDQEYRKIVAAIQKSTLSEAEKQKQIAALNQEYHEALMIAIDEQTKAYLEQFMTEEELAQKQYQDQLDKITALENAIASSSELTEKEKVQLLKKYQDIRAKLEEKHRKERVQKDVEAAQKTTEQVISLLNSALDVVTGTGADQFKALMNMATQIATLIDPTAGAIVGIFASIANAVADFVQRIQAEQTAQYDQQVQDTLAAQNKLVDTLNKKLDALTKQRSIFEGLQSSIDSLASIQTELVDVEKAALDAQKKGTDLQGYWQSLLSNIQGNNRYFSDKVSLSDLNIYNDAGSFDLEKIKALLMKFQYDESFSSGFVDKDKITQLLSDIEENSTSAADLKKQEDDLQAQYKKEIDGYNQLVTEARLSNDLTAEQKATIENIDLQVQAGLSAFGTALSNFKIDPTIAVSATIDPAPIASAIEAALQAITGNMTDTQTTLTTETAKQEKLTEYNTLRDSMKDLKKKKDQAFSDMGWAQAIDALYWLGLRKPAEDKYNAVAKQYDETYAKFAALANELGMPTAFAKGGIVTKPTLGLIGETGVPEPVIPLPANYDPGNFVKALELLSRPEEELLALYKQAFLSAVNASTVDVKPNDALLNKLNGLYTVYAPITVVEAKTPELTGTAVIRQLEQKLNKNGKSLQNT